MCLDDLVSVQANCVFSMLLNTSLQMLRVLSLQGPICTDCKVIAALAPQVTEPDF